MTNTERFGELMKQHRDWRTQAQAAKEAGCSVSTIEKMERGLRLPKLSTYIRLTRHYGLSPAKRAELDEIASGVLEKGGEA